jgi:riboflavin kinase/FMN adenylyltransferase
MQLFRDLSTAQVTEPTVLTIGTFDGLHRGHQALIDQLKAAAQEHQAQSAVIAFHPRPKTVLAPHLANNDYLTTAEERILLFEELGIDILLLVPFTIELSQRTARDFVKEVVERLNMVGLYVGHDFALGKNREGNVERLAELGREFNYTLHEVSPLLLDGQVVSSTQIRQDLLAGDVRQTAYLLGRYPSLSSKIVQGARRGHTIGFPTANLELPPERLLPANGVYATFVRRAGHEQRYPSVTNIGIRPSFGGQDRTVEAHIFDFDEEIYGHSLTLEFVERLRPEKKFENLEALIAQIKHDAGQARTLLTNEVISPA